MDIVRAVAEDVDSLMPIYDVARCYMRSCGNMQQWTNGYPSREVLLADAMNGNLYLVKNGEVTVGCFCFFIGEEPTYRQIYGGRWIDCGTYGVIHRLASDGTCSGIARACFDWCAARCTGRCRSLRVDTHRDNTVMQRLVSSYGFTFCGVILLSDGSERLAYQKMTVR